MRFKLNDCLQLSAFNLGGGVFLAAPPPHGSLCAPEVTRPGEDGGGLIMKPVWGGGLAQRGGPEVGGVVFRINSSFTFIAGLPRPPGWTLEFFPLDPPCPPPSGRSPALFMTPPGCRFITRKEEKRREA